MFFARLAPDGPVTLKYPIIFQKIISEFSISTSIFKSHGYLFHFISFGIIITRLFYYLDYHDLLHIGVALLIIVPPGLLFLSSMNNIVIVFPFSIGIFLGAGIMLQGLLYFFITLAYIPNYYVFIAISISVFSLVKRILQKAESALFHHICSVQVIYAIMGVSIVFLSSR